MPFRAFSACSACLAGDLTLARSITLSSTHSTGSVVINDEGSQTTSPYIFPVGSVGVNEEQVGSASANINESEFRERWLSEMSYPRTDVLDINSELFLTG